MPRLAQHARDRGEYPGRQTAGNLRLDWSRREVDNAHARGSQSCVSSRVAPGRPIRRQDVQADRRAGERPDDGEDAQAAGAIDGRAAGRAAALPEPMSCAPRSVIAASDRLKVATRRRQAIAGKRGAYTLRFSDLDLASGNARITRSWDHRSGTFVSPKTKAGNRKSGMASVAERVAARALGEQPKLRVVPSENPPAARRFALGTNFHDATC